MAITIGDPDNCVNQTWYEPADYTILSLQDAVGADGTITKVYVYATADISVMKVGSFHLVSGTTYENTAGRSTSRDLNATAGSCVDLSGDADFDTFSVVSGEYIGCNFDAGQLERSTSGGSGATDYDNGAADFGASTSFGTNAYNYAIYGTGTEAGGGTATAVTKSGTLSETGTYTRTLGLFRNPAGTL